MTLRGLIEQRPEVQELIEAYQDIIDYGPLVLAKKDQWARLAAAKAAVEGAKPSETS